MSKQINDPQNNNQLPRFKHWHTFRQQLRYELKRLPFLLLYLLSVFEWIVIQRPMVHLLVEPTLMMGVVIFAWELSAYTLRIWTHGPSEPPVTFHWWRVWEDLLTFVGPYVLLALLMLLNHYPW